MLPLIRFVPRRSIVLTATLVTAAVGASLATGAGAGFATGADVGRASAASVGLSWAHDLAGKVSTVTPTHFTTPVLAERVAHPDADFLGSTRAAVHTAARTAVTPVPAAQASIPRSSVRGIDVSSYQPSINWAQVAPHVSFVYVKATEGRYYRNPLFNSQYEGPYHYGVIRGSYHFAIPSNSSGTAQADYFIAHGGGWSADGLTLPGTLDVEYNPYGPECYGLTAGQMVNWIKNFITEYAAREHAFPVIYSTTDWWKTCTGDSAAFAKYDPFWIADYARVAGPVPAGWPFYSFWQYSCAGREPGDQDVFNGAYNRLQVLAVNG